MKQTSDVHDFERVMKNPYCCTGIPSIMSTQMMRDQSMKVIATQKLKERLQRMTVSPMKEYLTNGRLTTKEDDRMCGSSTKPPNPAL